MLLLAILFSVLLLVNFRLHAKWGINTSVAILLNYPICFLVGYLMQPEAVNQLFDLSMANNIPVFLLGLGFIVTFLFSGKSTVKNGMAVTSLANNMSLVLPVVFSLLFYIRFLTYPLKLRALLLLLLRYIQGFKSNAIS